jgi:uncharacterized zinc-type alcohol dehydrogenase-like protein
MSCSPITYPAYAVKSACVDIHEMDFTDAALRPQDVAIDITHNGICHSDIHGMLDEWKSHGMGSQYPLVPGHEAIGVIVAVGSDVTTHKVGDRVGCGPQRDSCGKCCYCARGDENECTGPVEFLYNPRTGGFGSHLRLPARFAFHIPDGISSDVAGPLMCAGLTVFSPLRKYPLPAGSKVAVAGVGGLGHLAIQYAAAMGYEVTAITRSMDKAEQIKAYGAKDVLISTDDEAMKASAGKFAMILNTISATIPADRYLSLLGPQGKLVIMGVGDVALSINPFALVAGNKSVVGSSIGGSADMKAMLEFSAKHSIFPTIEVIDCPFGKNCADKVTAAVDKVVKNTVRYRMVMDYKK